MIDWKHNYPPGMLPGDEDRAELERDGGDRERELDERLWREEDAKFWRRWYAEHEIGAKND